VAGLGGRTTMTVQKSPGGSIFPYYYKGGELFGIHFGSYFADEDRLIAMMKAEAAFFAGQYHSMGVWIDFYETRLTDRVIGEFLEFLNHVRTRITKLGIVGCSFRDKRRISSLIKKTESLSSLPVKYSPAHYPQQSSISQKMSVQKVHLTFC
jgi:hypothetical protein